MDCTTYSQEWLDICLERAGNTPLVVRFIRLLPSLAHPNTARSKRDIAKKVWAASLTPKSRALYIIPQTPAMVHQLQTALRQLTPHLKKLCLGFQTSAWAQKLEINSRFLGGCNNTLRYPSLERVTFGTASPYLPVLEHLELHYLQTRTASAGSDLIRKIHESLHRCPRIQKLSVTLHRVDRPELDDSKLFMFVSLIFATYISKLPIHYTGPIGSLSGVTLPYQSLERTL
jgi:hypothetical protein